MKKLGYKEFVAQGGDWGAAITEQMAVQAPEGLLGIHTNMPSAVPGEIFGAIQGNQTPANLNADEKRAFEQVKYFLQKGLGYALEMGSRPQTMYALADSPVGLAAWMIDHDIRSLELISRVFDGKTEGLSKDDILDNITVCWLTNTAVSSARLYWQNKLIFFVPMGVKIPIAVSAFPDELYQAPKSWVEKAYPNLIHYNRLEKGGHFAAWEQPKLLSEEIRNGLRQLRTQVH
jgi:pimeloyl-ACP methyl ester carboxylesterase